MRKKLLLFLSLFVAASVSAQMSGTYTINGDVSQNPDYQTINDAATAVASQGVNGNVTFEIAPGTYNEYVTLNSISGTSANARVTFKGMGDNNTGVVVTSNAGYTSNSTLKLDGPDFVTFENMTIQSTSENTAIVVELRGGLEGDVFDNVKFIGAVWESSQTDNNKNLVYVTASGFMYTNNSFKNCEFVNGCVGLYYQGQSMSQYNDGLLVENCTFTNQNMKGIYATFTDHVTIRGCQISNFTNNLKADYNAIDIFRCRYNCIFENNVMNVKRTGENATYATVFKIRPCTGTEEAPVIVRNNIINLETSVTNSSYALSIDNNDTDWVYVLHNTFSIKGAGVASNLFLMKSVSNIFVSNNLFINETSGYVFRFANNVDSRECDYNRVSFDGANVGLQAGTDYATLADWSTATGYDANTTTCTPNFVSATNLHLADATGSVTVSHYCDMAPADIDGETRSTTAPCAGADEFAEAPVEPVEVLTADFEDVELNASGIWMPTEDEQDDMGYAYMRSQGWEFSNYTYYGYVFAFTASNSTDTTTTGYDASFTAVTAGGHNSEKYAVVYPGMAETMVRPADGEPRTVSGCYITNNLWTYQAILEGDGYGDNTPFGGADGTDPDYLVIIATGYDADDEEVGTAEFYLADYRFENSADDYVVTDWKWFDLSVLGEVSYIEFTMDGTKTNAYGISTPTYFCMDDFNGEAPVEPVETLIAHFEDVELNADGIWMSEEYNVQSAVESQGWSFSALTSYSEWEGVGYESWSQFRVSNSTNTELTGLDGQYTAVPGRGHKSTNYAVGYVYGPTTAQAIDGYPREITGCYVTNNMYAYTSMTEGDYYAGGPFETGDYLVLYAIGLDESGEETGRTEFYLADYRSSDEAEQYIVTDWRWFDLSVLGEVSKVRFEMAGSRTGDWGLNTPAYFCMDDFNGEAPAEPVETLIAHFEDVELNADGIWQAETLDENTYLYSQGWKFSAFTSETYWSNFTVSNSTNTELTGYDGQYTATTGKGVNGSDNYAVAYIYNTEVSAIDGYPREITGCYVTNNMYAYTSMTEGDYYAGDPFTTGDYLVLYAIGLDEAGEETGRTEFYLADYRSSDEAEQYIVTDWRWFDLSVLGEVSKVRFEMAGSRTGDWGLNTPAYFCMDDFNGEAPDAVEETAAESVNISVYPNPSNGVVNIKVAENEEFTYYVYNTIGQTVMTGTSANAITTIDLSTFGSGMYLLNVNCKGNVNAKKVFIK